MQRRAMDLLKAGQFAEALAVLEQFLAIEPEDVNWLFLKGTCLLELRDYRAALGAREEAEWFEPLDPDVLDCKGEALLALIPPGCTCPASAGPSRRVVDDDRQCYKDCHTAW